MSDTEFTIGGETYFWGRKVGPADFGMVPQYPPETSELVLEWDRSTPEWEITIGESEGTP
jgi:hypothetical protein